MAASRVDAAELLDFLDAVDADDLWQWLSLRPGAPVEAITDAVRVRRAWAQAQQSNPRHRRAARWIIRHARTVEALLATDPIGLQRLDARVYELRRQHARRLLRQLGEDPDAVETLTHAQDMRAPPEDDSARARATEDDTAACRPAPGDDDDDSAELSTMFPSSPKGPVTFHVDPERILAHARHSGRQSAMLDGLVAVWRDQGLTEQQIAVLLLDELNLRVPM